GGGSAGNGTIVGWVDGGGRRLGVRGRTRTRHKRTQSTKTRTLPVAVVHCRCAAVPPAAASDRSGAQANTRGASEGQGPTNVQTPSLPTHKHATQNRHGLDSTPTIEKTISHSAPPRTA
ncbi:unnamed protein product, partial [Ectocarpus sp. 8 AP-2014]